MPRKFASLLFGLGLSSQILAAQPQQSIFGGYTGSGSPFTGYSALVLPNNSLVPLSVGVPDRKIFSVAMNNSAQSIVGGGFDSIAGPGYAALVSPSGQLTTLTLPGLSNGYITSVAINQSGKSLIGGIDSSGASPYAAFVSTTGGVQVLTLPGGTAASLIMQVAINDVGEGIIVAGGDPAFRVLSSGVATQITSIPGTAIVRDAAIINNGYGLIGGSIKPGTAYAAIVDPSGDASPNMLGLGGVISSVAMNELGNGVLGGRSSVSPVAYAAFSLLDGTVTSNLLTFDGGIESVDINSSSVAMIGGSDSGTAYAAFILPDGTVQSLNLPFSGEILSVAITDSQAAFIGGHDGGNVYAALVAPNGTVTPVYTGVPGSIGSVDTALLETVTPKAIGAYSNGTFFSVLAASLSMQAHVNMNHKQLWKGNNLAKNRKSLSKNISLASIDTNELVADARTKPTPNSAKWKKEYQSNEPYTAWVSLFNDFYNVSKEGSVPSFTNEVAGALAAIDYKTKSNNVFGGGLAYAFNYSHYSESLGHAKINEEMAVLFGSFPCDRIFVNATLWGGLFQVNNVRHTHTFTTFTATSHTHGWILNPHVELSSIAYRNDADWFAIEPFITEDWVNYWQSGYKERGASGFNLRMKHHYASLLRSEIGARFYEKLTYDWGRLLIEAKGSYINQAPFHLGSTTTAFVGAVSTFSVALGNNKVQNLAGVDLNLSFFPKDTKYPYGSVVFEGEFGSSLQSYFVALEIGKKF